MGQKQSSVVSNEWYDTQLIRRCKHIDFDVEAWYNILKNETFYTEFIPLSPSIAQAFVDYYQTFYNSKHMLNLNSIQLIENIQTQLKNKIDRFQNRSVFIRLSSRSPKDGKPLNTHKLFELYHQELNRLRDQHPNEYEISTEQANLQMIAYSYAQFHALKVTSEIEALNLILSSERVFVDLIQALACYQVQENKVENVNNIKIHNWNDHVILREWNDRLDPSMEFRCFVYQSKLTAISQYNHYCKYYHLQNQATVQQIKLTIIQYWREKIQPLLDRYPEKYANYIIDIGLMENQASNEYDCIVIEMNPFDTTTGASLFHWTTDINQLQGNGYDVEIRVNSDSYPDMENFIEYILKENQLNTTETLTSEPTREEHYFIFLQKIKSDLSS